MNADRTLQIACPSIISASCFYPSDFVNRSLEYPDKYSRFKPKTMLIDSVLKVAKDVLSKANIGADSLDLIVSLCLSSDHLAYDSAIGGPRLCHPLQNELMAKNAWVFDMTDSSLITTLQVAHTYLVNNQKKFALIVRAENSAGVLADKTSGFSWSDGVGAILIENTEKESSSLSLQNNMKNYMKKHKPCIVKWNDEIEFIDEIKGKIEFSYQEKLIQQVSDDIENLNLEHKVLYDGWFSLKAVSFSQYTKDDVFLGPLFPFYELSLNESNSIFDIVSFNPFSLELQSLSVRANHEHI
jgi:hypothetical protein